MEPKPKKRRSFVDFRRRSRLFDKMFKEDNEASACGETSSLTMESYLASLNRERIQWKDILHLRYKQLESIKNSCSVETATITVNDVITYFTNDDLDFLNEEPDYGGMMESANKYMNGVDFFKRYKSDVVDYYNQLVEEIKAEIDFLVDYLCDTEDEICEFCNELDCTDPTHRFPTDICLQDVKE